MGSLCENYNRNSFFYNFPGGIQVNTPTVKVDIFAQYIFSRISCRALGARKLYVSEKIGQVEQTVMCSEIWQRKKAYYSSMR